MTWPETLHIIVPPHTEGFGLGGVLEMEPYLERLEQHLLAAGSLGAVGAFVYDFPGALDPWLAAIDVLNLSRTMSPIVAVRLHQEAAESVARRAVDLGYRYERPTHVNLVAGATTGSRAPGERDQLRRQFVDYVASFRDDVGRRLPAGQAAPGVYTPVSTGTGPPVPADGALLLAQPRTDLAEQVERARATMDGARIVMLIGFVARDSTEAAWEAAQRIHGPDRRQEIAGQLFFRQAVSSQHLASYEFAEQAAIHDELLWFGAPMRGIDAPKLVGSYGDVRAALWRYRDLGVDEIIVDLPPSADEYAHIGTVLYG